MLRVEWWGWCRGGKGNRYKLMGASGRVGQFKVEVD